MPVCICSPILSMNTRISFAAKIATAAATLLLNMPAASAATNNFANINPTASAFFTSLIRVLSGNNVSVSQNGGGGFFNQNAQMSFSTSTSVNTSINNNATNIISILQQ